MGLENNFFTEKKLDRAIELPFSDIRGMLDEFVYFKGLINKGEGVFYVDGYFIVEKTELQHYTFSIEEIESGYASAEPDTPVTLILMAIRGTEYSNNSELIGNIYNVKNPKELGEVLFSYKQLSEVTKRIGCPHPKSLAELSKREYAYDVKLLNQKSNFTLEEMAKIAANIDPQDSNDFFSQPLKSHYMELLSDCIKGTNQHNFKLHTVELWCSYCDEFGERYSKCYENGTYLKQKAVLDYELTIISKQEFVRWCEYQNVDTGLEYQQATITESYEELEMKLAESDKEVSRLRALCLDEKSKVSLNESTYPSELQLAIDAYDQLCLHQDKMPTNKLIEEWLKLESKKRGITHQDGSDSVKGLSNVKAERIASIIKSKK